LLPLRERDKNTGNRLESRDSYGFDTAA